MRGAQVRCPSLTKSRLDRLKRAHAFWRLDRLARSLRNILPGIALIVGGRSPAQVVPGPAAQSLSPFSAMPKHLSIVGCGGFGPAAAGAVSMVNAAAKEPTMVAVLTMFLDPMGFSSPEKLALWGTCCAHFIAKPGAHPGIMFDDKASQPCDGNRRSIQRCTKRGMRNATDRVHTIKS